MLDNEYLQLLQLVDSLNRLELVVAYLEPCESTQTAPRLRDAADVVVVCRQLHEVAHLREGCREALLTHVVKAQVEVFECCQRRRQVDGESCQTEVSQV